MYRRLLYLVIVLLLGSIVIAPITANAQGCGITFTDKSEKVDLNEAALCEAAASLISKGLQIYVYVGDENPATEDDWFVVRDQIESRWGIYNPANDTFAKSALSIEVTTNTDHPWGQDIAFGEALFGTPLDTDQAVLRIEGQLKTGVKSGDVNKAIADAFSSAYATAFPPATPTPEPQPIVIQEGNKTEVNLDATPVVEGVGTVLWWLFILAILAAFSWFVGLPGVKYVTALFKHQRHISDIRGRVADLLNDAQATLPGEDPEATTMYAIWSSLGGKVSARDSEVRANISRGQQTIGVAFEVFLHLKRNPATWWNLAKVKEEVRAWETLYLTVIGRSEDILGMTGEEQANLLDPILVIEKEEIDDQLVAQIEAVRRNLRGGGNLKIKVTIVDQNMVDELGLLGSIDRVKQAIHDLRTARENARPMMEEVQKSLANQRAEPLPDGVTDTQAYGHVDGLMATAEQLLTEQKWLDAVAQIQKAEDALGQTARTLGEIRSSDLATGLIRQASLTDTLIPVLQMRLDAIKQLAAGHYAEAIALADGMRGACESILRIVDAFEKALIQSDGDLAVVAGIATKGFRLDGAAQKAIDEAHDDVKVVRTELAAGNYIRAEEYVRELIEDAASARSLAESLVSLHEANTRRLSELSASVARVEGYRFKVEFPAWVALLGYPKSNWEIVATNHDDAQGTLQNLFDDPANADDLASQIARLNDMDTQNFQGAHDTLDRAFVDLQEAEALLTATVQQLSTVQKTETELTDRIATVRTAIDRAQEFETTQDPLIDEAVQDRINKANALHAAAEDHAQAKEFMLAASELAEARRLAEEAYESAQQQVKIIHDLYDRVDQSRSSAEQKLAAARQTINTSQLPAGLTQVALSEIISGDSLYNQAKQGEEAVAGLQDHKLAEALQEVVNSYDQTRIKADQGISTFQEAKRQYEKALSLAQNAVESAERAIASAQRTMSDSDAGSAGSSALSRAQSALPTTPVYGITMDSLSRMESAANEAERHAETAQSEASLAIAAAEEERAAARRRRDAEEERQRAAEQARRDAAEASRRAAESARRSSYSSSSSMGSSSRRSSSSFGSSSISRSSSMGSSRRR